MYSSYSVQILEKVEGNGRTARIVLVASTTSRGKHRYETWMLKVRTVYPYALNDCLGDEYEKKDNHVLEKSKFPPLPRKYHRVFL